MNMERTFEKKFPFNAKDYKLYEEVGEGVSATVYRALCIPLNEIVAIKVLDLEKCNNDLDGVRREVQTMSLIDHSNVLRAHCSFAAGHSLWVVMPYMAGGSCLHIMKTAYPEGFEEPIIATLLREVLKALVYLHSHGHIHRDVKAGNILLDSSGAVKLGDFGVSACMFDTGDRQRSRNTFVGTPCWMAPEVMQQLHGYDFKADIWSFGITALELAHGHAPFSKYPPMKVLLMTLQNAPPGLDYERDKRFSKSFKELVSACLVKDPKKRPASEKLLKHHFFKHARSYEYLSRTILDGLPPLGDRFRILKAKEADLLAQNKGLYGDKEQLSQQEYMRGISAWNFNLEDLKSQAALIQDGDETPNVDMLDAARKDRLRLNQVSYEIEELSPERDNYSNVNNLHLSSTTSSKVEKLNDYHNMENSLSSFPIQPLQALKGYFDVDDEVSTSIHDSTTTGASESEVPLSGNFSQGVTQVDGESNGSEHPDVTHRLQHIVPSPNFFFSGSLVQGNATYPKKSDSDRFSRESLLQRYRSERNFSGPLLSRQRRETNKVSVEDAYERAVVQRKGRFKVTSSELSPKVPTNSVPNVGPSQVTSGVTADSILPALQGILQQNSVQREELVKLIKRVEQNSGSRINILETSSIDIPQASASARERELHAQVINLQKSIANLTEELQQQKLRNSQLEKQLSSLPLKER